MEENVPTTYNYATQTQPSTNYMDYLNNQQASVDYFKQQSLDANNQQNASNQQNAKIGMGIAVGKDLLGAYMQYRSLKQQKEQFNFSKDMAQKNFALAKDAYDRKVHKSDYIAQAIKNGRK